MSKKITELWYNEVDTGGENCCCSKWWKKTAKERWAEVKHWKKGPKPDLVTSGRYLRDDYEADYKRELIEKWHEELRN